jgi:hypothetical protein
MAWPQSLAHLAYGKEVGQSVNPLDFGTGVKITTFRFLPAGSDLGVAVLPDFEVSQSTAYLNDPLSAPDLVLQSSRSFSYGQRRP